MIYRAKNDPVLAVKNDCYPALAKLNTSKSNEYLLSLITEKKVTDADRARSAKVLLEEGKGLSEIAALASETVKDDRRKQLRYSLGKEMAKYSDSAFADVCLEYIQNKDNSTIGTGLDMWAKGRYSNCDKAVNELADKADLNAKNKNNLAIKAARLLGRDLEKQTEEKDREREALEAEKKAKKEGKIQPKKTESSKKVEANEKSPEQKPKKDAGDAFSDAK